MLTWLRKLTSLLRQNTPPEVISPSPESGDRPALRKAIAILAYNNLSYFTQVFEAILAQTVDGRSALEQYDLFVFQDGLQERHQHSRPDYDAIAALAQEKLGLANFIRRDRNLGIAMQFDAVERFLFLEREYDFAILFEHDFVIAPGYLEVLSRLAEHFRDDERVACISGHSDGFRASQEEQHRRKSDYIPMQHDWGAGVFRRAWLRREPYMARYYPLLSGTRFEERNHLLIQNWMNWMGFRTGATSQDYIKTCVDTALGQLRLSTFPNLGLYIGVDGMHWTRKIYEEAGYHKTVIFDGDYGSPAPLENDDYHRLLATQSTWFLREGERFDYAAFAQRVHGGLEFPANALTTAVTREDVIAAYKIFLNRFPESDTVIDTRVGLEPGRMVQSFLLSEEFLSRQQFWPVMVEAAKRILARIPKEEAGSARPAAVIEQTTPERDPKQRQPGIEGASPRPSKNDLGTRHQQDNRQGNLHLPAGDAACQQAAQGDGGN